MMPTSLIDAPASNLQPYTHPACNPLHPTLQPRVSHESLRPNAPRRAIDGHDAIFRANTAQQLDNPDQPVAPAESVGGRTTFRLNCLVHASAAARVPRDLRAELRRHLTSPVARASASVPGASAITGAAASTAGNASEGVELAGLAVTPTVSRVALPSRSCTSLCTLPTTSTFSRDCDPWCWWYCCRRRER